MDRNRRIVRVGVVLPVALLAEGVDRNHTACLVRWRRGVALLAEGVDRNYRENSVMTQVERRPPRGGRG